MLVCRYESIFGNRPQLACRPKEGTHFLTESTCRMGGHYTACAQRMDLLDHFGQESGDTKGSREESMLGTHRWDATALLLDRLHSPHGQANQPLGTMGTQ